MHLEGIGLETVALQEEQRIINILFGLERKQD